MSWSKAARSPFLAACTSAISSVTSAPLDWMGGIKARFKKYAGFHPGGAFHNTQYAGALSVWNNVRPSKLNTETPRMQRERQNLTQRHRGRRGTQRNKEMELPKGTIARAIFSGAVSTIFIAVLVAGW